MGRFDNLHGDEDELEFEYERDQELKEQVDHCELQLAMVTVDH
jgi:hypothetical protein